MSIINNEPRYSDGDIYYYHGDHLGNIREVYSSCKVTHVDFATLDDDGNPIVINQYNTPLTCTQRTQYYPSGLPWRDCYHADVQPIKYNSKEFVEMHGLDEYDSKARWYYPAIMRTTTMDPLCEKYYDISPYAWCGNNPVNYVDPEGRDIYRYDKETGVFKLYKNTNDNFDQVGKFKYNKKTEEYDIRTTKDGNIQTYADHEWINNQIAKGILKDGLNLMDKGGVFMLGEKTSLTQDDIFNFALILDEIVGKEISGFIYFSPYDTKSEFVQIEPYKNNTAFKSENRFRDYAPNVVKIHFHTHGHATRNATQPSEFDNEFKNKIIELYPSIQLYILHNYGAPKKY